MWITVRLAPLLLLCLCSAASAQDTGVPTFDCSATVGTVLDLIDKTDFEQLVPHFGTDIPENKGEFVATMRVLIREYGYPTEVQQIPEPESEEFHGISVSSVVSEPRQSLLFSTHFTREGKGYLRFSLGKSDGRCRVGDLSFLLSDSREGVRRRTAQIIAQLGLELEGVEP